MTTSYPPISLSTSLDPKIRALTERVLNEIFRQCDPVQLVNSNFDFTRFTESNDPVHVLSIGKASVAMTDACIKNLGPQFAGGVVLCPTEPLDHPHESIQYYEVDHPTPTPRNMDATSVLAEYAKSIPHHHECIVNISGGGSAHLTSPKPGITLENIVNTTNALNAEGATIQELNEARRSMDTLKAGGLARVLSGTQRCETIVLSDVLSDDLDIIASGPMMTSMMDVVTKVAPPISVRHTIVGNHRTALRAAHDAMESLNATVTISKSGLSGYASDQGRMIAHSYITEHKIDPNASVIFAGETTVDTSTRLSSGIGGPTLECTLSAALELATRSETGWIVLGIATDGIDGPSNSAGAVIFDQMLRTPSIQHAAQSALDTHDTLPFLESLGAIIRTGPTGTNLNDVCLVCPGIVGAQL
ncbi:MAG: DUF4147 domain-containing protein [Phycisphaerales bacterium]